MGLAKNFNINLSVKEAMELLAAPGTPKRVQNKIVAGIRQGNVTPRGALAAATAQVAKNAKKEKAATVKPKQGSSILTV